MLHESLHQSLNYCAGCGDFARVEIAREPLGPSQLKREYPLEGFLPRGCELDELGSTMRGILRVFDQSGHVVGIDTAIYSPSGGSVGIGFAIPSNLAKNIVAQLRAHGSIERGWLGVSMQQMTPDMAKAVGVSAGQGVIVASVQPNSPAARAELRQGDVITGFNGVTIKTPRDLAVAVANLPAGRTATMAVLRDGRMHDLSVTMGTQPAENVAATDEDTPQDD